jgi:hypothetical protein
VLRTFAFSSLDIASGLRYVAAAQTPQKTQLPTVIPLLPYLSMAVSQKPSINECYTPSSEPYRVLLFLCFVQICHSIIIIVIISVLFSNL